ncbi:hypothetical protein CPB86DRAFT_500521 [Serendipita vermifera]|nr:hypothetical protein CPB86DRAFT_500521 [Serendipita vermifera]
MYQATLLLLFSLLSLHLTNKCWAQELTYTIATIDPTATVEHSTTTLSSDIITVPIATIDPFTNISDDPSTYVIVEDPPVVPEPPSDPTPTTDSTFEPNSTTDGTSDSTIPTISETLIPATPSEFTAFTNLDVVRDCDELQIAWTGMDIKPPCWVSWSTGTGEIGDASILGEEIPMSRTCSNYIRWQTPPTSNGKCPISSFDSPESYK